MMKARIETADSTIQAIRAPEARATSLFALAEMVWMSVELGIAAAEVRAAFAVRRRAALLANRARLGCVGVEPVADESQYVAQCSFRSSNSAISVQQRACSSTDLQACMVVDGQCLPNMIVIVVVERYG